MNHEERLKEGTRVLKQYLDVDKVVEELLASDERCRNDDTWLILQFWEKKQAIKIMIPQDQIGDLIPAETITRMRRKIQNNDHKYLPTDENVIIKRKIRQEVVHDIFSTTRPDLVNAVIMKRYAVR